MTTPHTGDSPGSSDSPGGGSGGQGGLGGGPGGWGGRVRRVLAAFGRCLSAFGAMHIALADPHPPGDPAPGDTAPGDTAGGAAWWDGPPPAHPERLCGERPLTEQELRLARQLWPASYPQRRDRGR
jgi:hypothetical protein